MANAWPVPPPSSDPSDPRATARGESADDPLPTQSVEPDLSMAVDHRSVSAGDERHDLEMLLSGIAMAALELTEATGAALALRTQGAVLCRARAGEVAPPLGAKLDEGAGISGTCLRTGLPQNCPDVMTDARVDAEVSRRLGIRSLAVVPLRDQESVIGILEVFSDRLCAFDESHTALLNQLAETAVTCCKQAAGSEIVAEANLQDSPTLQTYPVLAIPPDSTGETLGASRWRTPLTWAVSAIGAVALLTSLGWIAWRGLRRATPDAQAKQSVSSVQDAASRFAGSTSTSINVSSPAVAPASNASDVKSERVASDVVVNASDSARLRRGPPQVVPMERPPRRAGEGSSPDELNPPAISQVAGAPESQAPPAIVIAPAEPAPATLAVSQGITGGTLVHGNAPEYPVRAKQQRIEGPVVLQAIVNEGGTLSDVQIASGNPILAEAAKQAVSHWQYAPYLLNGVAVRKRTLITIQFKLP